MDDIVVVARLQDIEESHDVGTLETLHDLDFAHESFLQVFIRIDKILGYDFDCDGLVGLLVVTFVDLGSAMSSYTYPKLPCPMDWDVL